MNNTYLSPIGSNFDPNSFFSFKPNTADNPGISTGNTQYGPAAPTSQTISGSSPTQTSTPAFNLSIPSGLVPTANAQTFGPSTVASPTVPAPMARPNAQAGDPWYGVKKSDVDANPSLGTFLDSLSQRASPPPVNPQTGSPISPMQNSSTGQPYTGYGVSVPSQTNSNVIGSNLSYSDVLNSRNQIMQNWQNAQTQYANDYASITGQQIKGQFSGDTTQYGTGMANLIQMESAPRLVADQMMAQNYSNMAGANAQTLSALSPMQVAPGSSLVSPMGGSPIYQGMGASPSTVMGTAQSLAQLAISNGSAQYNPDGSINMQPYLQQAQQYYGGGTSGAQQGGGSQVSGQIGGQVQGGYGSSGYGNINMIPPGMQYAVRSDSISGQPIQYMNASQIPQGMLQTAYQLGGKAGIPVLDQQGVAALNAAQQILGIVDAAKALSIRNLSSGVGGHVADSLTNWANNYLQFNPDLSNFDQLRDAASKATTALAGGNGSGFRMNMGIIEAATDNLPRAGDNLETALTRADALGTQIINGLKPIFPNVSYGGYGSLLQSQYGGNQGGGQGGGAIDWANLQ